MTAYDRLKELGIILPKISIPSGNFLPAVESGGFLFGAGQVPRVDGVVKYTGKLGGGADIATGYTGARICALNCLAAIHETVGLDRVERIVKLIGFVNATADFTDTPAVINGASDLIVEVFGEAGRHARSAIGVQTLPGGAVCEVELIAKLK